MAGSMSILCKKLFGKIWKKKPWVRFYSMEPGVTTLFPIYPSKQLNRKYRNWPEDPNVMSTKSCPGILKLTSTGWIIPAPADFIIKVDDAGISYDWREPWRFKTGPEYPPDVARYVSAVHGPNQTMCLLDDPSEVLSCIVKIETPWRVEASDDIVFVMMPVHYNNEDRFFSATGILDSRYGYNLNIQLFWKKKHGETLVKAGTPLCHIIPMKREYLSTSAYDTVIDEADATDWVRERAWVYASNCAIMKTDSLSARLNRLSKILKNYTKRK